MSRSGTTSGRSWYGNPPGDAAFGALIGELVAACDTTDELQSRLRAAGFREAVVRAREPWVADDEHWYVYRDGSWTRG